MDAQEQFDQDARAFLREFSRQRQSVGPRAGSGRADAHWLQGAVLLFFSQWGKTSWSGRESLSHWPRVFYVDSNQRAWPLAHAAKLSFPQGSIGMPDPLSASALACAFLALQPPASRKTSLPAPLPCNALDSAITLMKRERPTVSEAKPAASLDKTGQDAPVSSAALAKARLMGAALSESATTALPMGQGGAHATTASARANPNGIPSLAALLARPESAKAAPSAPSSDTVVAGVVLHPPKLRDLALPLSMSSLLLAKPGVEGLRLRRMKFSPGKPPYFSDMLLTSPDPMAFSPAGLRARFEAWLDNLPEDPQLFAAAASLAQDVRDRQSHLAEESPSASADQQPAHFAG